MQTRLYTLSEKKTIAMIFTLVARLAKFSVKTIDDTVIWIETKDFVQTNHPLIKTKSRRRWTKCKQKKMSRRSVTYLLWKERGTFSHANSQDSVSQELYSCLHMAEVKAKVFF